MARRAHWERLLLLLLLQGLLLSIGPLGCSWLLLRKLLGWCVAVRARLVDCECFTVSRATYRATSRSLTRPGPGRHWRRVARRRIDRRVRAVRLAPGE